MAIEIVPAPTPLAVDPNGVVRVGGTQVTLEVVIHLFQQGATAEEIALDFPAITLADVYGTITYYLHNTAAVDAYLEAREAQAVEARRRAEARFDPAGLRDMLLARPQGRQS
ncbi:MAG: DUF433 domain-containing protein [Gammaproteobacteria bacterium]|nr:DUF433 domain-containing protein [Gammaproteobacteria bacterium]